jgi:hypothetical protein
MIDKPCPWCREVHPATITRVDDGCHEWQCSTCRGTWTVKDGHPNEIYVFWPPDIQAMLVDDEPPFLVNEHSVADDEEPLIA